MHARESRTGHHRHSLSSMKYRPGLWIAASTALLLGACAEQEEYRVAKLLDPTPTPASFKACYGNSCRLHSRVTLVPDQWQQVRAVFEPAPADALAERQAVARAIGVLERFTGEQTGTSEDAPGMGVHLNPDGQLDCIDESTNSTSYLRMMAKDGLIRFHTIGFPAHRFVISAWGPSNTATMTDTATHKRYAVESYFRENGQPAYVMPLDIWTEGWTPSDGDPPET
jgi:hypothetical protein